MNITIFIGGLSGGGAERVVCNLSNYLSSNHKVTILTMSDDTSAYPLNETVNRVTLSNNSENKNYLSKNIIRLFRFNKFIRDTKSDVYLVMLPVTINIMLLHKVLIKSPIIVSERCDPYKRYESSKLKKFFMRKLYPKADGFVFQTEDAMDYYKKIINGKGIVIPNAINPEFIKRSFDGTRTKKIVSAGRLTNQKNFSILIRAFSIISKYHPEYELVIYGDGPQRGALERLVSELDLKNRVRLPGYVKDLGSQIIDSSLFVLSSDYEGMPNALMEAMALGVPCISTDCPVGGPKFLIDNNINGILTPVNNLDKLAEAMNKVLSDEEFAESLCKNAKNITQTLGYKNIYNKWESYIIQIVN
ncbi:MAG: glycosyltransferase family 4 protein [Alkalibacterium sp.]|nr:glycosyltransferase family 4 protein [Alkalibacterium sp.]